MGTFLLVVGMIVLLIFGYAAVAAREGVRRFAATQKYKDAAPQLRDDMIHKVIRIGMTEEQVIDSWGRPTRRTFAVLKTKTKTTLYFGPNQRVHLDDGRVTGWHQPTSTRSR